MAHPPRRCPVCRASFRETRICSRCGADLTQLMRLILRGHALRNAARQALLNGEHDTAYRLATNAQRLHYTTSGRKLERLTRWLKRTGATHPWPKGDWTG